MAIIDIIHDARGGLKKLKNKYMHAEACLLEIVALREDLEDELNQLDQNIKVFEQKFAGNITDHQMKVLLDGQARFAGLSKVLSDFDDFYSRHKESKPSDKFEKYMAKLENLEKRCAEDSINKKDCITEMEKISKYSNHCINFIDFYNRSKTKIESMLKILKEQNTALTNSLSAGKKGYGEWISDNFKSSLQIVPFTVFNALLSATVGFFGSALLRYMFSS